MKIVFIMLKELFIVSEYGTIITYENYSNDTPSDRKDPALISAFITAIQGFSRENFDSRFKGMELETETIFIVFDKVYTIGVFSSDELEVAAFKALNSISEYFNSNFSEQDYDGRELVLTTELQSVLDVVSRHKIKRHKLVISVLLIVIGTLFYFPSQLLNINSTLQYYSWAAVLVGLSIISGQLTPQRWVGIFLGFLVAGLPSLLVFVEYSSNQFMLSDYTYVMVWFPWTISSYITDRKYINTVPIPSIPIISNFF